MPGLLSLLGIAQLKAQLESLGRYAGAQAILVGSLAVLIVAAVGFALAALTVWLSEQWGPAAALAAVAGGLVVVALLLEVVIVLRKNARTKHARAFVADAPPDQAALGQAAFGSVAAVAILGYILGRQIMRR
jgi:hypothetical protein